MACYNHPNAPTAAHFNRCGLEMCGQCAQFLDQGEYCEKCAEVIRNEEFVKTQTREFNRPEVEPVAAKKEEETFIPPTRRRESDRMFIWLGVGGSSTMIFAAMLLYSFPLLFETAEAETLRVETQRLEDCRLVFEEISYYLRGREAPPASLLCADSNMPNLISNAGGRFLLIL